MAAVLGGAGLALFAEHNVFTHNRVELLQLEALTRVVLRFTRDVSKPRTGGGLQLDFWSLIVLRHIGLRG